MVKNIQQLIGMIAKRDDISRREAEQAVRECQEDLREVLKQPDPHIEEVEDILKYDLGLEPDYLEILLF